MPYITVGADLYMMFDNIKRELLWPSSFSLGDMISMLYILISSASSLTVIMAPLTIYISATLHNISRNTPKLMSIPLNCIDSEQRRTLAKIKEPVP